MNMLSGAKYLKDGHPVMVDKDGRIKNIEIFNFKNLKNTFVSKYIFFRRFNGFGGTHEFFAWISLRGIS